MSELSAIKVDRKIGFYESVIKRLLDILCSSVAILLFGWLFLIVALLVRIKLGSPIVFTQYRPGIIDRKTGKEKVFKLYKFRTMTDGRDDEGNLLPDEIRLTEFGKKLRSTSLDELPECFNILNGTMSLVGPRPQLVRDMVFMTDEQRVRHTAKPGLTGLAQVNGRNSISWEEKLDWDIKYVENISFSKDVSILFRTFSTALFSHDGITEEGEATATDFGDYLLQKQLVTKDEYDDKQIVARNYLDNNK